MKLPVGFALLVLATAAAAQPAHALGVLSTAGTGPVGNCQGALPTYEGSLRKRPLAITNEGTEPVFITCALTSEEVSLGVQSFFARVSNLSTTTKTIECTAVVGDELTPSPAYIPRSATVAPGSTGTITWTNSDIPVGLLGSRSISISCVLPPLTSVNRNSLTVLISLI